jgi:hypothetical protein
MDLMWAHIFVQNFGLFLSVSSLPVVATQKRFCVLLTIRSLRSLMGKS